MKPAKIVFLQLSSALIVGYLGQTSDAVFVPTRYEARHVTTAPVIDGDLSDPVWNQAQEIGDFFAYQSGGDPPAAQTSAKILWDDDNLYVAFEMLELDIRSSCALRGSCGRDANLFQGDVIELFVRESTSSPRYHEFEWSPLSEEFDARFDLVRFGPPGINWDSGMSSAAQVQGTADNPSDTDSGWTVESVIPLSDFENSSIVVGSEWRFTVARYDYYNVPPSSQEALMMSTPGDPDAPNGGVTAGFHTYEIYDILEFTDGVPEPSDGDTDGDGDVDDIDLGTMFGNFTGNVGAAGGKTPADGDTDGDGDVDDIDLSSAFGDYTGSLDLANARSSSVPEPSTVFLAALGLFGLVGYGGRQRRTERVSG